MAEGRPFCFKLLVHFNEYILELQGEYNFFKMEIFPDLSLVGFFA